MRSTLNPASSHLRITSYSLKSARSSGGSFGRQMLLFLPGIIVRQRYGSFVIYYESLSFVGVLGEGKGVPG